MSQTDSLTATPTTPSATAPSATAPSATAPSATAPSSGTTTQRLLACGVVVGPIFLVTAALQALTRQGFDLSRHPLSMLSLGDLGWIQIANFLVAGALSIAFAVGSRRALHPGPAGTWGPALIALFGAGFVVGGVFVTDPWLGFPVGVPEPAERSWHAVAHDFGPVIAVNALVIACSVFARRFGKLRQRSRQIASIGAALVVLGLTAWPDMDGMCLRLAAAVTVLFAWMSGLALHLMRTSR